MREIIFRGKCVLSGEWIEGDLLTKGTDYEVAIKESVGGMGVVRRVDPATVGQFTGLLDKNGKRIFEGDVCRFREWSRGEMCWIGNIHYENQQFVISGGPNKECETPFSLALSRFVSENIEVIGAIYDNSELLEVTPDA